MLAGMAASVFRRLGTEMKMFSLFFQLGSLAHTDEVWSLIWGGGWCSGVRFTIPDVVLCSGVNLKLFNSRL